MPSTPFVPFESTVEAELRFLWDEQRVEMTQYYSVGEGSLDITTMTALGAGLVTWFDDHLSNYLSHDISLREVYITDLTTNVSPTVSYVTGLPLPGLVSEGSVANDDGIAISLRTLGRGRSTRGRNYVPGMRKTQLTNSHWDTSYVNGIVSVFDLLRSAPIEPWIWCVASRKHNGAWRTLGVTQPITAVLVTDYVVDSQRRRLPGRGT